MTALRTLGWWVAIVGTAAVNVVVYVAWLAIESGLPRIAMGLHPDGAFR